jgi:hypothetical protein
MNRRAENPSMRRLAAILAVAAALGIITTGNDATAASVRRKQSFELWQQQDRCAKDAFLKFPDYTPAGIDQRNAAIRACDKANHLTPRPDPGASSVRRIPDAAAQ